MKKLFVLLLLIIGSSFSISKLRCQSGQDISSMAKATVDTFLEKLPNDSTLKKMFQQGSCSHCNDIAVAAYLLKSQDAQKRKIGFDIFYNAILVALAHAQLTPEETVSEIEYAEKAIEKK